MAAGLGFKTFVTGDVLTAADTNGYLMQGVWVFANAAARTAAVTSPQEGNASFLKDTNSLEIYDGAAWVAYGAGDITGVTAGTGISGGGTSGTVTVTNSMATEITASGDIIVGTGSATFDNLPIGSTGQILTADTTVSPYKVKWASPTSSAQNFSLLGTGTLTGAATVTVSGISGQNMLMILVKGASSASSASVLGLRLNTDTASNYKQYGLQLQVESTYSFMNFTGIDRSGTYFTLGALGASASDTLFGGLTIFGANSAGKKMMQQNSGGGASYAAAGQWLDITNGFYDSTSTISSVSLFSATGNFDAGTFEVYGSA